jgi:hypothetical protein
VAPALKVVRAGVVRAGVADDLGRSRRRRGTTMAAFRHGGGVLVRIEVPVDLDALLA